MMLKQTLFFVLLIMSQVTKTQNIDENQSKMTKIDQNNLIKIETELSTNPSNTNSSNTDLITQNLQLSADISQDSVQTQQNSSVKNQQKSQLIQSQQAALNSNLQSNQISMRSPQVSLIPQTAQKFYFHWLNNNGSILSAHEDWIKMEISTPQISQTIICTDGHGYTYTPGRIRKFNNFWIPIVDKITISLYQYNFFSSDDATNIQGSIDLSKVGYYSTTISLSQFRAGSSIGLSYAGFGVQIHVDSYTKKADYYLLNELTSEEVPCCGQMSLPPSCSLSQIMISLKQKILFSIAIIAIMIFY